MRRASLFVVALFAAACQNPAGRGASDGGALMPPPGCVKVPSGMVQVVSGNPSRQTGLAAAFQAAQGSASCTEMTTGSCVVTTTQPPSSPPAQVGAGTITISGGAATLTATPMTSPSDGSTTYANVTSTQSLWQGGEMIAVAATGGTAPAFSTTLSAPAQATVTMPVHPSGGGPLALSRQDDLPIAWSGEGFGTVDAEMLGVDGPSVYVHCRWPLSAHGGVVPAAALARLPSTTSSLVVTRQSTQLISDGDWTFDIILATGGVDGAGALASYSVMLP